MSDREPQPIAMQPIEGFLGSLASRTPTPGGGASAALTGATAAATAAMVVGYSIGKKSLAEHESFNRDAAARLARAGSMFLELGDEDAIGYARLNALWKLDKDDPARVARWEETVRGAIGPPRAMLALGVELLRLCATLVETTSRQLRSDLAIAAVLGQASARASAWNVRINIPLLGEELHPDIHEAVDSMLDNANSLCAKIESGCA